MGKSFEGRSLLVKLGILSFYIVFTTAFFLVIIVVITHLFQKQLDIINNKLLAAFLSIKSIFSRFTSLPSLKKFFGNIAATLKDLDAYLAVRISNLQAYLANNANLIVIL